MSDMAAQTTNRLDDMFARCRAEGKAALMPFITLGDPDCGTTLKLLLRLEETGADVIELGVPYSDPLADGPVIQRAAERALRGGVTLEDSFRVARQAREQGASIPYVLFTYYNPVMQYGIERFFRTAAETGFSGAIIPDLPYEESGPVRTAADACGIHLVPLVAPTSEERISRITAQGRGFIYCVSSLGVTGVRDSFDQEVERFIRQVKATTPLPVCVGFGISTPTHVKQFSAYCDGVIVGSAIVRKIEEAQPLLSDEATFEDGILQICDFVRQLRN
ncbi:tryptophan synthase subunit alpha [Paenibacillus melissococcoides]|uniref:Tryptophan synthase alpha chain n=1 Tax=Paenibacillus melissococcoides TaxID=2912268 RepID=A0ABN8U6U6_9BACL|nr:MULTISPECIES: tryptophan synthase subunit alpha [Paenibacillus]MEB9895865.1 tryptophan synthase subunit alpha [Bacillus cereus]CAH8245668.1 tryptophan synthase subunit alpha [Paenibacillus melissococcoides]CAH8711630.1 tryptophan synthase subunit alpha [Paenibacillus melissococcoides]CAH8712395.1 tryptophan synthase subunit alpha [Paenibacillus melissococcoides]GIO77003.1 tryptophan synthase alpha chain [Paenibacillus dendritiformis]